MKSLVLGGVKSGKSRFAEHQAQALFEAGDCNELTLIATAEALDDEMNARIQRHKDERAAHWQTLEAPIALAAALEKSCTRNTVVVIDCLTLWLTNLLMLDDSARMDCEIEAFVAAFSSCESSVILVSNETNMGIVPLGDLSRRYCDVVGILHQRLATICQRVDLVVAGLPLPLKPVQVY